MDIVLIAKAFAFVLLLAAAIQVIRSTKGMLRWYFLAFLLFLTGSLSFFGELELTKEGVLLDWLKHVLVYAAFIFLYCGWARFLFEQRNLFDRRAQ